MPAAIPYENARTIARKLSGATAAQLNSFFDNALHVGPYFLSEQTATPHAAEEHLYGLDLNYSDINQVPYVGLGVNTMRLGWNLNATGRIDSDYSGFALCWEHRYTINDNLDGVLVDEWHFLGTTRDAPPDDWRMFSMIKPQIAADSDQGTDNGYFSCELFAFYRSDLTTNALMLQMDWVLGLVDYASGVIIRSGTPANGTAFFQQRNAANSAYIPLPYLDANNTLKIDQPIIVAGATNAVTNALMDLTPASATNGQKGIVLNGPAVTGTYYLDDLDVGATVNAIARIRNTSAGASAHCTQYIASSSASGFAQTSYRDLTTGNGVDIGWSAVTDKFHISYADALGYAPWDCISINPAPAGSPVIELCVAAFTFTTATLTLADAVNIVVNATTGTKIGTATGQKLGFWNATPVVQQVLATGAGATVDNVISLLQTLGLCKQA